MKYKFVESFKVVFEIESETEARAKKAYSELFDKNIQLGFDKWKDTDLKILVGKFHLEAEEEEE